MRKNVVGIVVGSFLFVFAAGFALSLERHGDHSVEVYGEANVGMPDEGGQSAFAAIAEIVALLEGDPETDWSKVNISALRSHLVDMNDLTLRAKAEKTLESDRVVFAVRGEGTTLRAIQAMVPAHAVELNRMEGWSVSTQIIHDGAILSVVPDDINDLTKINGLGFFGLMATGAHHQPHHLGMAKGTMHVH